MLTPTETHYLVGLLTKVAEGEDVVIELGSRVFDVVAEQDRDIDITVVYKSGDGLISIYKGIEVKKHSAPLDVSHVEQLCIKFDDMHEITSKAIVSASGYSKAAVKKAKGNNVELLEIADWIEPRTEFSHIRFPEEFEIKEVITSPEGVEQIRVHPPQFKILRKFGEVVPISGCAIATISNGNLGGISVSNSDRNVNYLNIPFEKRIKQSVYKERLSGK